LGTVAVSRLYIAAIDVLIFIAQVQCVKDIPEWQWWHDS